jgi:hypothetical protein
MVLKLSLQYFYSFITPVRVIKPRRMSLAGYVARTEEKRGVFSAFQEK